MDQWNWSIRMNFRAHISEFTFRNSRTRDNRSWQPMDNGKLTTRVRAIAMTALVAASLSACGDTSDWIKGRITSSSEDAELVGAPEIEVYVAELSRIASGDPAAQAEIFADATAAAQLTPSPSTNLRLGLVLSIPGHPESNPEQAQSILREVLTLNVIDFCDG